MSESPNYKDAYRQEAEELLEAVEQTVLDLEQNPDDSEAVNRLFRAIHTIKGSGSMFGFDEIAAFTHHVETVLDKVRDQTIDVSKELIDLILRSRDQISFMLQPLQPDTIPNTSECEAIISDLNALLPGKPESSAPGECKTPPAGTVDNTDPIAPVGESDGEYHTYRIRFKPYPGIFTSGLDPAGIIHELRQMGSCQVVALVEDLPTLDGIDPEVCYLRWDMILTTQKDIDAVRDVFIFVEQQSEIKINEIAGESCEEADIKRLGEILIHRGDATADNIEKAAVKQKRIGDILVESGVVSKEKINSALAEQRELKKRTQQLQKTDSTVRVPAEKLDRLINLVGELVIVQARLTQVSSVIDHMELGPPVEEVERLTGELRDCALNIRMLPIGTTFSRFKRLVRDLSDELNKEIELVTQGGETELDKTVIERLGDPLVHLIRNSIDHGIEPPDQRQATGKSRQGTIRLTAAHVGAHVLISVEDDGAGLDKDVIKTKAVEKKIINPEAELDEQEIFKLIFSPGFSTASQVTSVSGRGVGMDVVKREIDALRGTIDIASKKGGGTTIRFSLPLTLAIIDGLLVKAGESRYVLPLTLVGECVELTQKDIAYAHGRNLIPVRGELIPYIRLREIFSITDNDPELEHIAIVELGNMRVGIVVDEIIGNHQTVIKSLGPIYKNVEGVSGATILGDGGIALIVDVAKLIRCAQSEESDR